MPNDPRNDLKIAKLEQERDDLKTRVTTMTTVVELAEEHRAKILQRPVVGGPAAQN
jgi:hypothetical protein